MSTPVHAPPEPGLSTLVKGIVDDIGDLIKQQFQFAKTEIKTDLRKTRDAVLALAIGAGVAALGGLFFCFMLVYLLHWLASPPSADPASLPLWACYGIVSLLFLGGGFALILVGKKKFDSFNPLPVQTVESLKENVQWITNQNSK